MLNMALNECLEGVRGMRPEAEIAKLITVTDDIKINNPNEEWESISKIGEGGQAKVFKVRRRRDGLIAAMKKVINVQPREVQKVMQEASLIKCLDSNEMIRCVDLYHYRGNIFIMLEFLEQGSLTDIVTKNKLQHSEDFCRYSLYKVALGLRAMHRNHVLHRDIKSDNILHSVETGDVKITDLGYACFLSEEQSMRKTQKGTPNWVAPEIANGIQYAKSVDIWSFGCFAYELATRYPPHADKQGRNLLDTIINTDVPEITGDWSADFKDFVKMCLKRDPDERYNINQVLRSKFLVGLNDESRLNSCKLAW